MKKVSISIVAVLAIGTVVLLGMALFGGGDGGNLARIKIEQVLNKPAEEVFTLLSSHERYQEFADFDESVLLEDGDTEKNGVGALRRLRSGRLWFQERITCFERPKKMCYHVEDNSLIPMTHELGEITIEPMSGKSKVTWMSDTRIEVPLFGSFLARRLEAADPFSAILKGIENAD